MLVAYAFLGVVSAETDDVSGYQMNTLERWNSHQDEASKSRELSDSMGNDVPRGFSYLDGPYPYAQDNGALGTDPPDAQHMPWGSHFVSDVNWPPPASMFGSTFRPTDAGGSFIVGEVHEFYIGDQNGNSVLEWIVFYYYFPWQNDGLDNDGDGCVDEYRDPWGPCDLVPDAMVFYETGGSPRLGGRNGSLLVNLDWYDGDEILEVFRALVSLKWHAYQVRGTMYYPQVAGEFISYYAREWVNRVNANPEMDNDQADWYVGSINARLFPNRPPVNQACSAGLRHTKEATYERDDGWVVTSYSLVESFDDNDWNGDGDKKDNVAAYYAINPSTGNCRIGVNGAVAGRNFRNSGEILMPQYTYEKNDGRDWDKDHYTYEYVQLYHNISTTWSMKGKIYRSYTYLPMLIKHQRFGFGWWGLVADSSTYEMHPLNYGGASFEYVGSSLGYYHTYFFLTSDEDGNRHTELPTYDIGIGTPSGVLGGKCILITAQEQYLRYANVWLMPGPYAGDGNGDGDASDSLGRIFCPSRTGGGGSHIVEPTSKFATGQYTNPIPFIWLGDIIAYSSNGIPGPAYVFFWRVEAYLHDDCDGDLDVDFAYCYTMYRFAIPPGGGGGKGKTPRWDPGVGPEYTQDSEILRRSTSSSQRFSELHHSSSQISWPDIYSRYHIASTKIVEGSELK